MNSILMSTSSYVAFHLIVCGKLSKEGVTSFLSCFQFSSSNFETVIVGFDMSTLDETILNYQKPEARDKDRLDDCGHYARLFLPRLLPMVDIAIYMDTDIATGKGWMDGWMNGALGHFFALSKLNWAGDNLD